MKRASSDKSDLVRDEILLVAQKLFRAYGLDMTTMESIAAAAGKSKGTLYYYFKSKEDVFYTIASRERITTLKELHLAIDAGKTAADRLRAFFLTRENISNTKRKLYPIIFREQKKHIEFFHKLRRESIEQEVELLERILLGGVKSGEFPGIRKTDCDTVARTQMDSLQGKYLNLILDGKSATKVHTPGVMLDIFIRGIS